MTENTLRGKEREKGIKEHFKRADTTLRQTIKDRISFEDEQEKEITQLRTERNAYRHREKVTNAELKWFKEELKKERDK